MHNNYIYNKIPGRLVFDIGSNRGSLSSLYTQHHAQVVAVEPNKNLTHNNPNYSGIIIENVCISDNTGTIPFFVATGKGCTLSSCREDWKNFHRKAGRSKKQIVACRTLESLIRQYGIPVYIKIDVEGYENIVLRTLQTPINMISIEYTEGDIDNFTECLEIFKRLNFKTFIMLEADQTKKNLLEFIFKSSQDCLFHFINHPPARTHGDMLVLLDNISLDDFHKYDSL